MVGSFPVISPKQKALLCTYVSVLMDMAGSALTVPIMPYYVNELGGSPAILGTMFATFAVFQVLASAWMGWASDKLGRRPILLISLSGSGIGMIISALAPDYKLLFFARAFLGFFSGSTSVANAYVAEIVPPTERARLMALIGAMAGLAFMFGPPIGSGLAEFGLRVPFYVGGFTSLLAFLVAYFYLLSPAELDKLSVAPSPKELWTKVKLEGITKKIFKRPLASQDEKNNAASAAAADKPVKTNWKAVGLIVVSSFIGQTSTSTLMTNAALFIESELGWGQLEMGFIMMATGGAGIFIQIFLFGPLSDRLGVLGTGVFGSIALAIGQFGIASSAAVEEHMTAVAVYICSQGVFTLGMMLNGAVPSPSLAAFAEPELLGRVVSLGAIASAAGRIFGPIMFGAAFEISPPLPYTIAGFLAIAATFSWGLTCCLVKTETGDTDSAAKVAAQTRAQAMEALQEELKAVLVTRGYNLESKESVKALLLIIDHAFPEQSGQDNDEATLLATHSELLRAQAFSRSLNNNNLTSN